MGASKEKKNIKSEKKNLTKNINHSISSTSKYSENQAGLSESRFQKIVQLAENSMFLIDENYNIEFVNSAGMMMIEDSIENIVGHDFREFISDKKAIRFLEDVLKGDGVDGICYYSEEGLYFGRDSMVVVEMSVARAKESGGVVKLYVYLHKITGTKKLKSDILKTNDLVGNIISRYVDCIIAADIKGSIILFNESAEKLLGYTAEEARKSVHITQIYKGDFAREVMRMLRSEEFGGVGKMASREAVIIHKMGEEIPCNLSATLIYDEEGNEVASTGVFSDLREKKRIQKELEETQMKLLQSEKMSSLGKLSAGVAHEINNPLGGIMIFANIMLEDLAEDDPRREDLKRIVSEASRCKNIVKGLLDFSRQTHGERIYVDVNKLIEQCMSILENQAIFHNIEIIKDFDKTMPPVKCDSPKLNQVFVNLILNAVDALGNKGKFVIKTIYRKEKNMAQIEFTDSGIGIPEDIQPKIFDPFFTTKEVGKGTGLGLSMSYGIINDHGGTIDFKSKVGEGTTFIIKLPIE
ncbi:ATP-binding protein [Spirochaetota bacterium]